MIDGTGLFPGHLLAEMQAPYLAGEAGCEDIWLTFDDGRPRAVAYCAPERMTDGTWNLYLIAVHPEDQGRGYGGRLMAHLEAILPARGGRVLLVETSGLQEFARTRAFYVQHGYAQEARIREFYRAGEDKIVFWKRLTA